MPPPPPRSPRIISARRFNLPPGYSLATDRGSAFRWTKPRTQSKEAYTKPEDAVRAAWADAGLPAPDVLSVATIPGST